MLMKQKKPICYYSETFSIIVANYPTYDKELYALAHSVNKWNHYIMGKETITDTDHHPSQHVQSQNKLQHP